MPVNMPTHGHGQGYADLNFLIPELVERAHYRKGPYFAEVGDFSSAGGVGFDLVTAVPEGTVQLALGTFDYQRVLAAGTLTVGEGDFTGAVEFYHNDGPWDRPDDYQRFNGFLGYSRGDAFRGWSLHAMGSDGEWLATDQIPRRAVDEGLIDRYGLLDPGPRGSTSRYSLSGEIHRGSGTALTSISGYAIRYDFDLISNFTYFLDDPENGDQFEQVDDRWVYGMALTHRWNGHIGAVHTETAVGLNLRYDDISNGLYRTTDLVRTSTTRQDDVGQLGAGLWGESWLRLSPKVKLNLGLRADYYDADVTAFRPANSGSASDWMLNPKATVVWSPASSVELYFNAGSGFHSNDARGTTIRVDPVTGDPVEPVDPLVRATGIDLGFRTFTRSGYHTTVSLFWLDLDSELLFVGDAGATEASRPSRRVGIEWTNYWQIECLVGRRSGRHLDRRRVHRRRPRWRRHSRCNRDNRGGGSHRLRTRQLVRSPPPALLLRRAADRGRLGDMGPHPAPQRDGGLSVRAVTCHWCSRATICSAGRTTTSPTTTPRASPANLSKASRTFTSTRWKSHPFASALRGHSDRVRLPPPARP